MSKSVPTSDDVIKAPSAPVNSILARILIREERALDGVVVALNLDLLRELIGEVLSETVVLTCARATDRLADLDHRFPEARSEGVEPPTF